MWQEAKTTQLENPRIIGVIHSAQKGSPDQLVIRYDLESNFRSQLNPETFVLVPIELRDDSCIVQASGQTEKGILAKLTPTQHESLTHMHVTTTRSPDHTKGYAPSDPAQPLGEPTRYHLFPREDLEVLPFRRTSDGGVQTIWLPDDPPLPSDALALILPRHAARPTKDIESAKSRAALLTPLMLVADVFVTPVLVVAILVSGNVC